MAFHEYPYTDFHEMNLDWVIAKVKELTLAWAQTSGDWEELRSFVNDYFANLNVQTEINNKLDELISDGTLSALIAPYVESGLPAVVADQIAAVVANQIGAVVAAQLPAKIAEQLPAAVAGEAANWLSMHVDPETGYVIDNSLTIAGAAADAKVVGDAVDDLRNTISDINNVLGHATRNIFTSEMEQGGIDSSGNNTSSLSGYYVRSKDYMEVDTSIVVPADNKCYVVFSWRARANAIEAYYYDDSQVFISKERKFGGSDSSVANRAQFFIVPSNASYVRVKLYGNSGALLVEPSDITNMQMEYGYTPTSYVEPFVYIDITGEDEKIIGMIENHEEKTNTTVWNLYDQNTIETGCYYYNGRVTDYRYSASDYIEVEPGESYVFGLYISGTKALSSMIGEIYDESKIRLSVFTGVNTITIPSNGKYIRVSGMTRTMRGHGYVVVKGSGANDLPAEWIPHDLDLCLPDREEIKTWAYACGDIICVGDSITDGLYAPTSQGEIKQNYPYYLGRMLSASVENAGVSGATPTTWLTTYYPQYDFTDYDSVILWLGSNGGLNVSDVSTPDTETYAYTEIIDGILAQNENIKIFALTVFATGSTQEGVPYDSVEDTNAAIRQIASDKGCIVIDMSDLNSYNHPELHNEMTGDTHFGKAGFIFAADRIIQNIGTYLWRLKTRCEFGIMSKN